ncbi:MAG: (d)CMP kinase [Nitrososphaerales archaeon]
MKSVIISGMPASGKTAVARRVAEQFDLRYLCGGDILKEMAVSRGYKPSGEDWWDTENGMKFLEERKKAYRFDHEVDERLVKAIEEGGVVVTSYTAPWLAEKGGKIWLKASPESRARRLASRDGITYQEAFKIVERRDSENIELYRSIYGFNIGEDLSVFDLVLDTDGISKDDVIDIVCYTTRYFI